MDSTRTATDRRLQESEPLLRQWEREGKTLVWMAKRLGCCVGTVRRRMAHLGIVHEMRKHRGPRESVWEKRLPLLRAYCEQGMSMSRIARLLGTNKRHVRSAIGRYGIRHVPYSLAGENNPAWRGGVQIDKNGYVLVYAPNHPHRNRHNKILLHRLVMEKKIGRTLLPSEVVHHIDKNKLNNHPSNLSLYQTNGRHLADELKGCVPKWTNEGRKRISEGARMARQRERASRQASARPYVATHPTTESGGAPEQPPTRQIPASPGTGRHVP